MGLTSYGETQALNVNLPNGTSRYIALFTSMSDADGTSIVEASGSSYARKLCTAWVNETVNGVTYRKNNGAIEFAALSGSISGVVGWGIYDALTSGNLIAAGYVRDVSGVAVTKNFVSTNQPRFLDQELKVGLGNVV